MKKNLLTFLLAGCAAFAHANSKATYTTDITRSAEATNPTQVKVSTNAIVEAFKLSCFPHDFVTKKPFCCK